MFFNLDLKELIATTAEAKLGTSFKEIFDQYFRLNNPTNGGEKVFDFDALRLLKGISETWKDFYNALANSQMDLLEENRLLLEEKKNTNKVFDSRLQKAHEELAFKRNQSNQIQEQYSERGVQLAKLEKKINAIKKKSPKNVLTFTLLNVCHCHLW